MWPHRITILVGSRAVVIATDAADVANMLDPWRIDNIEGPVDYFVDLAPPARANELRPLPGVWHGACAVMRGTDRQQITEALLRVLSSHARTAPPGQVRVALMPVLGEGVALLVPPPLLANTTDRDLGACGLEALHVESSLIDVPATRLLPDPPLGGSETMPTIPVAWWCVPSGRPGSDRSLGTAVAEVLHLVVDLDRNNAAATLRTVADLVTRLPPAIAPDSGDEMIRLLVDAVQATSTTRDSRPE